MPIFVADVAGTYVAQLIVNDYWQIAIDEKCPWVHLGQEDLVDADIGAIGFVRAHQSPF